MNKQLCWFNIVMIPMVHIVAIVGLVRLTGHVYWATLVLAAVWFILCGFSITAGYHRLFTHRSYECVWPIRFLYLMFGAASAQGSVVQWVSTHVQHHAADNPESNIEDPHDIQKGFWYAHCLWLAWGQPPIDPRYVRHLVNDPLVRWEEKYYGTLVVWWGFVLPMLIAASWGDALGGLLVAGFLRTTIQWHVTWCINSVSHTFEENTFNRPDGSRTSRIWPYLLVALGESNHSFHHEFPAAYGHGWKWWHVDPTKWLINSMAFVRLAWNLKRTPDEKITRALLRAHANTNNKGG